MLFYRLNKYRGSACSNHDLANRGVAALLIVIIVLVSLLAIATTVFYQSRSGLKVSSQDKLHRELLSVATGETMHTAEWIRNWFNNKADSAKDPLVFMSDPNPGGKP